MRKKYLLLCIGFALFTTFASAQIKIGVDAGMNLSHFKASSDYSAKKKGGMKPGFQIGATVDYEFKKHWMLMSGLSFVQTQSRMQLAQSTAFFFPDTDIKLNHFMLPLKVGYNFHLSENFSLVPSVGFYGFYNFSAGSCSLYKDNEPATWKPMKGFSYEVPGAQVPGYTASIQAFRHWTYGGIGGLKAVIYKHYTVSIEYYEGIKKAQKQNTLRDYGLQISVGYQF